MTVDNDVVRKMKIKQQRRRDFTVRSMMSNERKVGDQTVIGDLFV